MDGEIFRSLLNTDLYCNIEFAASIFIDDNKLRESLSLSEFCSAYSKFREHGLNYEAETVVDVAVDIFFKGKRFELVSSLFEQNYNFHRRI